MGRQRSAKPLFSGPNPLAASMNHSLCSGFALYCIAVQGSCHCQKEELRAMCDFPRRLLLTQSERIESKDQGKIKKQ